LEEFEKEIHETFQTDVISERIGEVDIFSEQSILTRDPYFQDGAFLEPFSQPSFLYGTVRDFLKF
jgi:hypothetical protein